MENKVVLEGGFGFFLGGGGVGLFCNICKVHLTHLMGPLLCLHHKNIFIRQEKNEKKLVKFITRYLLRQCIYSSADENKFSVAVYCSSFSLLVAAPQCFTCYQTALSEYYNAQ